MTVTTRPEAPAPTPTAPTPAPWPGEMVLLGRQEIHVRRMPATAAGAEPAVYVHGLGGSGTNWTDLAEMLSDRVDSLLPDLPGFGWSPAPADGDYSVRAHADSVIALLEKDARGPVHLFGNSLGGAVATRIAALRPDLVRTLTLISPALPAYRPRPSSIHLPVVGIPWLGERLVRLYARLETERRVWASLRYSFADPGSASPRRIAEAVAETRRREKLAHESDAILASLRGVLATYFHRGDENPWRLAARVQAPTLLVYGAMDRIVDPRSAPRAARTFPRATLSVLPRTGHVAQMEHPALVAGLVRRHLDASVRAGG